MAETYFAVLVIVAALLVSSIEADGHGEPDSAPVCSEMDQCNTKFIDTLQLILRDNQLDCQNFARYLSCIEGYLTECQTSQVVQFPPIDKVDKIDNSGETPAIDKVDNSSATDDASANGDAKPDGEDGENATESGGETSTDIPYNVSHAVYAKEFLKLVMLEEARNASCPDGATGPTDIAPENKTMFLSFYNRTRRYGKFEDYSVYHYNISQMAGCESLSQCSSALDLYANYSEVYFPCQALLDFRDCFDLNVEDCPDIDDLSWLPEVIQSIDQDCYVDSSTSLVSSVLLLALTQLLRWI